MKKLAFFMALVVMLFSMSSCSFLKGLFTEPSVVTTKDNVSEEYKGEAIDISTDIINSLPQDLQNKLKNSGKELVIVPKEGVKDPTSPAVEIAPSDTGSLLENVLGLALSVANTVWPGVAILEGLGILLSKRKRKHYAKVVTSLAPTNGKVEITDAVASLVRAIGFAHSSKGTAEKFEEEVKKVA